ncbi:MAG: glycoside hydrolase family 3 protein, partial [Gaiellaceae bacterium]
IGAVAAARALRVRRNAVLRASPLVIELVPEPMIAAGKPSFRLGDAIRARWPEADVVSVCEAPPDGWSAVRSSTARPLVLGLRDAGRHPWQREAAGELVGLDPDAVVVETGLPGWLPAGARASVETYGAGRVNLEAAVDVLAGTSKAGPARRTRSP